VGVRRAKRWLFRCLVIVGCYGLLELGSFGITSWRHGRAFSFSEVRKRQKAIEYHIPQGMQALQGTTAPDGALFVIHPFLGKVRDPEWPGQYPLEYPVSQYGFCDVGPPIHKRGEDRVIIGILGGSVASIFARQGADALRTALRRSPRFHDKEIVLVNLAISGTRQPEQVMAFNYALALGGEFDIILNIDGHNEVAHYALANWGASVFPLFPCNWHLMVGGVPDPTTVRLVGRMIALQEQRSYWARVVRKTPLTHSVTANVFWAIRDRRYENEIARAAQEIQQHGSKGLPYRAVGPPFSLHTEEAMYHELASIWERCSLQLHRTCRGHGIAYYHFLQPNQYIPDSKPLGSEERRVAWLENHPGKRGVERGYPLLRQGARRLMQQGVHFRDLSYIFKDHPEPLYVDTCCHFGHEGNEIMARVIADTILETPEPPREPPAVGMLPEANPKKGG
jgi:hypothetical protein